MKAQVENLDQAAVQQRCRSLRLPLCGVAHQHRPAYVSALVSRSCNSPSAALRK
jgi:hypothetical protein